MKMTKRRLTVCLVCLLLASLGLCLVSCGEATPPPSTCTHTFGEWAVTTEPTCEAAGTKTRTCTLCSKTETAPVDATGHSGDRVLCEVCGEPSVALGAESLLPVGEGDFLTLSFDAMRIPSGDASLAVDPFSITLYVDEYATLNAHGTVSTTVYEGQTAMYSTVAQLY